MDFKGWFAMCEEVELGDTHEARKFGPLTDYFPKRQLRAFHSELGAVMPRGKIKHSLNVAKSVARVGGNTAAVKAALFHDFLERGGNAHTLAVRLGIRPQTVALIDMLSNEEKFEGEAVENAPLEHVRSVLSDPSLDPDTRNSVILIKLSDRIDNLNRRLDAGNLGKGYLRKSKDLATFLFSQYTGDRGSIMILRGKLKTLGVKVKKRWLDNALDAAV